MEKERSDFEKKQPFSLAYVSFSYTNTQEPFPLILGRETSEEEPHRINYKRTLGVKGIENEKRG